MLLIDCGNSSLKAQYHVDGQLRASYAGRYDSNWLEYFSQWIESVRARRAVIASVLDPARQAQLDACLRLRFGDAVDRLVSQAESCGVVNAYAQPQRLGVDRWLALLGAAEAAAGDCIVVDAGSAITLDLLRADGQHLGGAIIPGVQTSMQRFKQIFNHIDFSDPRIAEQAAPGCSTEAAIQIDYAEDSLEHLQQLVNRWSALLNPNANLLLAGGDAPLVQRQLGARARIVPDLVFRGMYRLAAS